MRRFILGALTPARDPLTPGSGYDFSFYACERTNGSSDCWIFSSDGTSVYQYDPGDGGWDYVEFWYKGHMPMAAGTDSEGNVICSADTILAEARVSIGVGVMTIRGTNSPSSDIWCYVGSC
ncbi:MAG: hypothetical protein HYT80_10970 [Euryarchaeota archaeon]|nr:hypothetical protein [Euryarchaeota archaeon]